MRKISCPQLAVLVVLLLLTIVPPSSSYAGPYQEPCEVYVTVLEVKKEKNVETVDVEFGLSCPEHEGQMVVSLTAYVHDRYNSVSTYPVTSTHECNPDGAADLLVGFAINEASVGDKRMRFEVRGWIASSNAENYHPCIYNPPQGQIYQAGTEWVTLQAASVA